jgi:hypothetical protein
MAQNISLKNDWNPNRYSIIPDKCPREIVMLVGRGCFWKKCAFCDYHLDCEPDEEKAFSINKEVLKKVIGYHHTLEVINSGSVFELDKKTLALIKEIALSKAISTIYFESHYHYRYQLADLKKYFAPIKLEIKLGVESFDYQTREILFNKGLGDVSANELRQWFEDCCLLIGIKGQKIEIVNQDIIISLATFKRVCINIFTPNDTAMEIDHQIIKWFKDTWYAKLINDKNVDVLLDNSAFGVGGVTTI